MCLMNEDDAALDALESESTVTKKKTSNSNPTQRTLKYLRECGYSCAKAEYWNAFAKRRKDLYDFFDIIAMDPMSKSIIGVQCTTTSNMSSRIKKAKTPGIVENMKLWKLCGGEIWVIGWSKKGDRGKRKTWQPTVKMLTLDDLCED